MSRDADRKFSWLRPGAGEEWHPYNPEYRSVARYYQGRNIDLSRFAAIEKNDDHTATKPPRGCARCRHARRQCA